MDRLGQLLGFLGAFGPRLVELGELLFGDEIDRADPLALGGQALERRRFRLGIAQLVRVEAELLGQPLRHAFELLDAGMREFRAARLLRFGARRGRGAALARIGRCARWRRD